MFFIGCVAFVLLAEIAMQNLNGPFPSYMTNNNAKSRQTPLLIT